MRSSCGISYTCNHSQHRHSFYKMAGNAVTIFAYSYICDASGLVIDYFLEEAFTGSHLVGAGVSRAGFLRARWPYQSGWRNMDLPSTVCFKLKSPKPLHLKRVPRNVPRRKGQTIPTVSFDVCGGDRVEEIAWTEELGVSRLRAGALWKLLRASQFFCFGAHKPGG